jgi:DNA-binding MarR family transcriptional regulator
LNESSFDPVVQQKDVDARIVAALERVSHTLHKALWDAAWKEGLSASQLQFLIYLLFYGQEDAGIGQLAERFALRHSTVSDAVTALESKGLIQRSACAADRRAVVLRLTPEGKRVARRLARWAEGVRSQLAQMEGPAKATFLATLLDLIARLQQAGQISVVKTCTTCHYFERHRHTDPEAPHHCRLLDQPLRLIELRLDCPEHLPASASDG